MNNVDAQLKEVNLKFARLVRTLGSDNTRGPLLDAKALKYEYPKGTPRYELEVEFAHALYDAEGAPEYRKQHYIDKANLIVADLIKLIKQQQGDDAVPAS